MSIEQKQAVATIMMWCEQVFVVLPISAGKGMLFMLFLHSPGQEAVLVLVSVEAACYPDLITYARLPPSKGGGRVPPGREPPRSTGASSPSWRKPG